MTAADDGRLFLYEEVMLLFLGDKTGAIAVDFAPQLVAGAVMADLLLAARISVEKSHKRRVTLEDKTPMGEAILDECLRKIAWDNGRTSIQTWIARLSGSGELRHRIARQLCDRGILRADEETVLFLFTRRLYPEINPEPEREVIERLRRAILSEDGQVDQRTAVLISLAKTTNLLTRVVGWKEIKAREERIEKIANGELIGQATQNAISSQQAAIAVAMMMPVFMVGGSN